MTWQVLIQSFPSFISSTEELLDLVHPRLGARVVTSGILEIDFLKLFQQFFLPLGQIDWSFQRDVQVRIEFA